MVNDDPSTAHDIWKAKMSVTKSCCCMESGDEVARKAEAFLTGPLAGRCHVDWAVHVFLRIYNKHLDICYVIVRPSLNDPNIKSIVVALCCSSSAFDQVHTVHSDGFHRRSTFWYTVHTRHSASQMTTEANGSQSLLHIGPLSPSIVCRLYTDQRLAKVTEDLMTPLADLGETTC
jgi:hypothetical protein